MAAPNAGTRDGENMALEQQDNIETTTVSSSSSRKDHTSGHPDGDETDHDGPVLQPIATRSLAPDDEHYIEALERTASTEVETAEERRAREPITHTRTGASVGSTASRPPDFEVIFEEGDPENPRNWPLWYRGWCLFVISYSTWLVVLYSTSFTSSSPGLIEEFDSNVTYVTLGLTTYLLGLAVGCVVLAPLSELYGRRSVYLVCMACWTILVIPGGAANSLTTIITMRFFW